VFPFSSVQIAGPDLSIRFEIRQFFPRFSKLLKRAGRARSQLMLGE